MDVRTRFIDGQLHDWHSHRLVRSLRTLPSFERKSRMKIPELLAACEATKAEPSRYSVAVQYRRIEAERKSFQAVSLGRWPNDPIGKGNHPGGIAEFAGI
jgi:hypothetical protein